MKKCIRCQVVISKKLRPGGWEGLSISPIILWHSHLSEPNRHTCCSRLSLTLSHRRFRGGKHHPDAWSTSPAGGGATEPLPADGGANHLPHLHRQPHPPSFPVRPWGMRALWRCAQRLPHLPPAHPRPYSDLRVSAFRTPWPIPDPSTKALCFIKNILGLYCLLLA